MQTFLPIANFHQTAKCLDMRRLGKQRVEVLQILQVHFDIKPNSKWKKHPAVKMWEGHSEELIYYGFVICNEWIHRGYKDTCYNKIMDIYFEYLNRNQIYNFMYDIHNVQLTDILLQENKLPSWFGNDRFHSRHRAALLHKNYEHYKQFQWKENPEINYWWPISSNYI